MACVMTAAGGPLGSSAEASNQVPRLGVRPITSMYDAVAYSIKIDASPSPCSR